jgi:hypothetical protein
LGGTSAVYPSEIGFQGFIRDNCGTSYRTYTGRDFDTDTIYSVAYLSPTEAGWKKGDRGVTCFVYRIDGRSITGSVRAAR